MAGRYYLSLSIVYPLKRLARLAQVGPFVAGGAIRQFLLPLIPKTALTKPKLPTQHRHRLAAFLTVAGCSGYTPAVRATWFASSRQLAGDGFVKQAAVAFGLFQGGEVGG